MVWLKIYNIFHVLGLKKIGQNYVSCDLRHKKLVFLEKKNTDLTASH